MIITCTRQKLLVVILSLACSMSCARDIHYGFSSNKVYHYSYKSIDYINDLNLNSNVFRCDLIIEYSSTYKASDGLMPLQICISNISWSLDPLLQTQWKFGAEAAKEWKPIFFNIVVERNGRIHDTDLLDSVSKYQLPFEQKFFLTNIIILRQVAPFVLSSLIVETIEHFRASILQLHPPRSDKHEISNYFHEVSWLPAYGNQYYKKELNNGLLQLTQEITINMRIDSGQNVRLVHRQLLFDKTEGIFKEARETMVSRSSGLLSGDISTTNMTHAVLESVLKK